MSQIEFVNETPRLVEVIDLLRCAPQVAIDLESNGFFRYRERVCLVQLASDRAGFLVDPLAIKDVEPLGDLLRDKSVEKVFHAAHYDLQSLDRDWGFRVENLFDTSIAAKLVGSAQLGLQPLVEQYAGVKLVKSRKLQRSDWTKRPLSPAAKTYAINDVLYLRQVRDALSVRLEELSRWEWAREEFERLAVVRHTPVNREATFLSVKGSHDLDGRGRAVLRALFQWREGEARRLDRPVFKVLSDKVLLELASNPATDNSSLKKLGWFGRPPANKRIKAAIKKGLRSELVTSPKRTRASNTQSPEELARIDSRLRKLKAWRSALGTELGLEASVLWPRVSLERLSRDPTSLNSECNRPEVRSWQMREFGESLESVLASLD